MDKTFNNILNDSGIKSTDNDDWLLYVPCTYNNSYDEVKAAKPKSKDQRIFIIASADELCSKSAIWENLVLIYGRDSAKRIMPTTYILNKKEDKKLFEKEYSDNKLYILKKNIQRQEGLKITNDKSEILSANNENYVVAQELLQDPYLIDGRKINMRFYLLIICKDNEVDAYVYNDGFMYYTKDKFKKNSKEVGPNITTGYIDRSVYEKNPLTHGDFKKYLDSMNRKMVDSELELLCFGVKISDYMFDGIYKMLAKIVRGLSHFICDEDHLKNNITFQLFGVDVAINDNLKPQLMEINKGPDLGAKDKRDKELKNSVVRDLLKVVKILPMGGHGFIKIVE